MKFTTKEEVLEYAAKRRAICEKVKEIIVEQLCLDLEPAFITDDQPLFGRGLSWIPSTRWSLQSAFITNSPSPSPTASPRCSAPSTRSQTMSWST